MRKRNSSFISSDNLKEQSYKNIGGDLILETEQITGKISKIIFKAPDNDYTIINLKTDEGYKTVKGKNLPNAKNVLYCFSGRQVSKTGNRYFQADFFENVGKENIETNADVMEYITSGIFPGIGPKKALAIIDKFGDQTIDIIENHTEKLSEIKGISDSKLSKLIETVKNNCFMQEFTKEMLPYGITANQCAKLSSIYGEKVADIIHENPYRLVRDLRLDFKTADEIAEKMCIDKNSDIRIDSAFKYVTNQTYAKGSTGIALQELGKETKALLGNASEEAINTRFLTHIRNGRYKHVILDINGTEQTYVFTNNMLTKEKEICDSIVRLKKNTIEPIVGVGEKIKEIEKQKGITLDSLQILAIKTGLESAFTIISGGPGTGKTTIMDIIISIFEEKTGKESVLLAPTGKAARKLSQSTKQSAYTIHSYFNIYDLDADINEMSIAYIKDKLVIVDEASMLDVNTSVLLLSHIRNGCRVILVGDICQLPSVGPGAVLKDILNSNICTVIRLERIFRTGNESLIYNNTQKVNRGIKDLKQGDDFHMYRESDVEKCKELMTDLYIKRVAEYGLEETIMLLPYRKGDSGCVAMNKYIQAIINPPAENKHEVRIGERIYRVGDMVMHVQSNTKEVSNGDTGVIKEAINIEGEISVSVLMNGKLLTYDRTMLDNLELAYAITIHKSQGSEYSSVITNISNLYNMMMFRNICYVAFSRSKQSIDVVFDQGLYKAIDTPMIDSRVTLLPYLLKRASGEMVYDIY